MHHTPARTIPALFAWLVLDAAVALAAEGVADPRPDPLDPERTIETVRVVADSGGDDLAPVGASASVIDAEDEALPARSVTDLAVGVPGVSDNGQGGLFQVISIRGVSGQRVMSLIDDMRVVSERRAGASVSFIDPTLIGSVEIVRGPTTTLHGSGAVGGVMHLFPRAGDDTFVDTGWSSEGDGSWLAGGSGGEQWSVAAAARHATDAETPDGATLHSGFTQVSAVARARRAVDRGTWDLLIVPTRGSDIGKDNSDYPERVTDYPRERHLLARVGYTADSGWSARAWVHPNDLRTEVSEPGVGSTVDNRALDYGGGWQTRLDVTPRVDVRVGVDLFGRSGVESEEEQRDTTTGDVTRFLSLDGARETELGAFSVVRWTRGGTVLEAGARSSWQDQGNRGSGGDGRSRSAVNGFVGARHVIGDRLELSGGARTGSRFPSLTELFYSGTTGRGQVIGNPDLDQERSLGIEAGLRWIGRSVFIHAALFDNRVEDYIERVTVAPDVRSYVNLTSGTIRGGELHVVVRPGARWSFGGGGHLLRGRASDDRPLADVPPAEVFGQTTWTRGRWRIESRLTWRDAKDDAGDGERPIPSARLLAAAADFDVSPRLTIGLFGANLLDESYYRAADDKASLAPGRSIGVRLRWHP